MGNGMKIGPKIRRLRKLRGLTIEELAGKADLTKGFISQLERDKTVPSVVTLKQVLDVLGVDLATFFSDLEESERNIYTKNDRIIEREGRGFVIQNLIPKLKYLEMEPQCIVLSPEAQFSQNYEEDEGFGFILKGRLELRVGSEKRIVNRGDCFYIFFDNRLEIRNLTKKQAEVLLVNY